jgi:N-acetylneuraminic acid mutarotase
VLAEGKLLLFFGGEGEGQHYNDVHVLDTEQWNWFVPPVSGEPPCTRAYHAAVMCGSKMVIIGGGNEDGTGKLITRAIRAVYLQQSASSATQLCNCKR